MRMQVFKVKKPSCKILKTKNCFPFEVQYTSSLFTFINTNTHTPKGGAPIVWRNIYSNKKETSDFHGTVSFDPVKISQQK